MTHPEVFSYRPYRIRIVCGVAAALVFIVFTLVATALTTAGDEGVFQKGDQFALIGLGAMFALGILSVARPKVTADARGIRIRNIVGGVELPWQIVRAVSFERGQPWMSLELADDDTVLVLAVQAVDKERALAAVLALRAMLAASREPAGAAPEQG